MCVLTRDGRRVNRGAARGGVNQKGASSGKTQKERAEDMSARLGPACPTLEAAFSTYSEGGGLEERDLVSGSKQTLGL